MDLETNVKWSYVFCKAHLLTRLFLPKEATISDIETRNCAIVSRTKHANERIELLAFADVGIPRRISVFFSVEHITQRVLWGIGIWDCTSKRTVKDNRLLIEIGETEPWGLLLCVPLGNCYMLIRPSRRRAAKEQYQTWREQRRRRRVVHMKQYLSERNEQKNDGSESENDLRRMKGAWFH